MPSYTSFTPIATVQYADYDSMRSLLLGYGIESTIKPNEVDDNGEPLSTLVDVFVPAHHTVKAMALLTGNEESLKQPEPLMTVKMTQEIIRQFPFLNRPLIAYMLYLLIGLLIILAILIAVTHKKPTSI